MSDVVYKYPVELTDEFSVMLPRVSQILTVQVQLDEAGREKPFMWVKHARLGVPTHSSGLNATKIIQRRFRLAGTGHPIDEPKSPNGQMTGDLSGPARWQYIGSFQLEGGRLVFHLFVEFNPMGIGLL